MRYNNDCPICPVCQSDLIHVCNEHVDVDTFSEIWYCHRCEHEYQNVEQREAES